MSFSYKKLWVLLAVKEMNKTKLREKTGIGTGTLAKLSKNEYVAMEVLDKLCTFLNCDISDIMEYLPDQKEDYR